MNITAINWNDIPEVITKDQLYQICHISKVEIFYTFIKKDGATKKAA